MSAPVYPAPRFRAPKQYAHTWSDVEPFIPWDAFEDGQPIDILVFSAGFRVENENLKSRVWTTHVPSSSFCDCGGDLMVSSPEFVFLQLAPELEVEELIALGMELCGTYSLRPADNDEYCRRREPLTSVAKIKQFVQNAKRARGREKALRALKYVTDGSASAGETETTMYLHMPVLLGGYGIKKPMLNWRIDYDEPIALVAGRPYCKGDICWPKETLDVEYYGKVHDEPGKMESDAGRVTALTIAGYTVLTVTHRQLHSLGQFEEIARDVAKRTGKRLRPDDLGPTERRARLRMLVSGWHDRGGVPLGEESTAPVVRHAVSWADDFEAL